MRKIFLLAFLGFISLAACKQNNLSSELIGVWKGEVSQEGMTKEESAVVDKLFSGIIKLTFSKKSRATMTFIGQFTEGTYSVDGNEVVVKFKNQDLLFTYQNGKLHLDEYDMSIIFTKE